MGGAPINPLSAHTIVNLIEPWHGWHLSGTEDRVFAKKAGGPETQWWFSPIYDGVWRLHTEATGANEQGEVLWLTCHGETNFTFEPEKDMEQQKWGVRQPDDGEGWYIYNLEMGMEMVLGLDPHALLILRMGEGELKSYRWDILTEPEGEQTGSTSCYQPTGYVSLI